MHTGARNWFHADMGQAPQHTGIGTSAVPGEGTFFNSSTGAPMEAAGRIVGHLK